MNRNPRPERASRAWAKNTADKYITPDGGDPDKSATQSMSDIEIVRRFLQKWTSKQAVQASNAFERIIEASAQNQKARK
jgi:hypothetical protein